LPARAWTRSTPSSPSCRRRSGKRLHPVRPELVEGLFFLRSKESEGLRQAQPER
jgi:hypothetical protein